MAAETYKAARLRLFKLLSVGNQRSDATLKTPWIEFSDGNRLWFKTQAVYLNSHSLFIDIRGMSAEQLLEHVAEVKKIRGEQ